MPVILTTDEGAMFGYARRGTGALQRPLKDDALKIVMPGASVSDERVSRNGDLSKQARLRLGVIFDRLCGFRLPFDVCSSPSDLVTAWQRNDAKGRLPTSPCRRGDTVN